MGLKEFLVTASEQELGAAACPMPNPDLVTRHNRLMLLPQGLDIPALGTMDNHSWQAALTVRLGQR